MKPWVMERTYAKHYGVQENGYRHCRHCNMRVNHLKLATHARLFHGIELKPTTSHLTDRQYTLVKLFTDPTDPNHYLNVQQSVKTAGYRKAGQEKELMSTPTIRDAILEALKQQGVDDNKVASVMEALLTTGEEQSKARMIDTYFKLKGAYAPQEVNHAMQTTEADRMRKRHEYLQSLQLTSPDRPNE